MPFDPVKIPQNVYVEDRVIGPVSLRQLFMMLGGGGVSYVLWSLAKQSGYANIASGTIAAMPTIIMILFAFVKINQISLARFCLLMIERLQKPSKRYWQPRAGIELRLYKQSIHSQKSTESGPIEQKNSSEIDALSSVLDSEVLQATKKKTSSTPA